MRDRYYAGVGSRKAPLSIQDSMFQFGAELGRLGWTLRSGGAEGSDDAFERGCDSVGGKKEIYLPWKQFNGNESSLYPPTEAAILMASTVHPAWEACSREARFLHGRNCHQALGQLLNVPVEMVLCWTVGGGERGGTATAMKVSSAHGARIFNLFELDSLFGTWRDDYRKIINAVQEA